MDLHLKILLQLPPLLPMAIGFRDVPLMQPGGALEWRSGNGVGEGGEGKREYRQSGEEREVPGGHICIQHRVWLAGVVYGT